MGFLKYWSVYFLEIWAAMMIFGLIFGAIWGLPKPMLPIEDRFVALLADNAAITFFTSAVFAWLESRRNRPGKKS